MKSFKQFIQEALSDRHKKIIDSWDQGNRHSFSDHAFGGPKDTHHTVTIPLNEKIKPDSEIEDHISHVLDNADSYHENTHEAAIRNPAATEDHIDNAEHLPHLHDAIFEVRHDRGWHDDY